MKKEKEYGQLKIVSLDGSTVYKHGLHLFGLSGLTVLKNGKVDVDRFRGVLDESLDTIRLEQLCKEKKNEPDRTFEGIAVPAQVYPLRESAGKG